MLGIISYRQFAVTLFIFFIDGGFMTGKLTALQAVDNFFGALITMAHERLEMYDRRSLKMDSPVFDTFNDFIEWHAK